MVSVESFPTVPGFRGLDPDPGTVCIQCLHSTTELPEWSPLHQYKHLFSVLLKRIMFYPISQKHLRQPIHIAFLPILDHRNGFLEDTSIKFSARYDIWEPHFTKESIGLYPNPRIEKERSGKARQSKKSGQKWDFLKPFQILKILRRTILLLACKCLKNCKAHGQLRFVFKGSFLQL